jgi:DNA-binding FrmR family transcriptional regulator
MADDEAGGLKDRLARQGEDALGKLASDLLENPLINSAITRAFSARERAVHAQEAAMGALNIPSAADIDKLTRRLRTVSGRLEGVEDRLDAVQQGVDSLGLGDRLTAVEDQLAKLVAEVASVAAALDARPVPVPREQERLAVDSPPPKPARKRAAKK